MVNYIKINTKVHHITIGLALHASKAFHTHNKNLVDAVDREEMSNNVKVLPQQCLRLSNAILWPMMKKSVKITFKTKMKVATVAVSGIAYLVASSNIMYTLQHQREGGGGTIIYADVPIT